VWGPISSSFKGWDSRPFVELLVHHRHRYGEWAIVITPANSPQRLWSEHTLDDWVTPPPTHPHAFSPWHRTILFCCRLEACALTGACCEDLASAFTHCKTLWGINLQENALDHSGLIVLFEALKQQQCTLHVLGWAGLYSLWWEKSVGIRRDKLRSEMCC
jgi:hypothetical protein